MIEQDIKGNLIMSIFDFLRTNKSEVISGAAHTAFEIKQMERIKLQADVLNKAMEAIATKDALLTTYKDLEDTFEIRIKGLEETIVTITKNKDLIIATQQGIIDKYKEIVAKYEQATSGETSSAATDDITKQGMDNGTIFGMYLDNAVKRGYVQRSVQMSITELFFDPDCAKAFWGEYKVDDFGIKVSVGIRTDTNYHAGYVSDNNTQYTTKQHDDMDTAWQYHLKHLSILSYDERFTYILKYGCLYLT